MVYFKTIFKGKILQSGRGVNSILITILHFRGHSSAHHVNIFKQEYAPVWGCA